MKLGIWTCAALSLAQASPASAADVAPTADDGVMRGPILPDHLVPPRLDYWKVGFGVERFGTGFADSDFLAAIAVTYRRHVFGPNALFLAKPRLGTAGYEESRFLLGLGLRAYYPLWGIELSYGVGVQGELRFENHFWLLQAMPLEVSAVLYRKHSLDIELFAGARVAFAGHLIDSFLLDPNGFLNEAAQAELDRATGANALHGFVRLVISRRID